MRAKKGLQSNKGFTLVELIVVLVILAILAAILVPALLGYIDRAKEQQIVLNAKSYLTAAQAEFSSMYAKDKDPTTSITSTETNRIADTADIPECTSFVVYVTPKTGDPHANFKITGAVYKEGTKEITYDGSSWDKDNGTPGGTPVTIK